MATENPAEYTFDHLEAAACMWEHVLERVRRSRRGERNPWGDYADAYGMSQLRSVVIQHAPVLEEAYQRAKSNETYDYDKTFDWDFVPKYMEDHVTRILT